MILGLSCVTVVWKSYFIFFTKKLVMLDCIHLISCPQIWLFSQQWLYLPTQNIVWSSVTLILSKHISQQFSFWYKRKEHSKVLAFLPIFSHPFMIHLCITYSISPLLFLLVFDCLRVLYMNIMFLKNALNGETSRHADFLFLFSWCTYRTSRFSIYKV